VLELLLSRRRVVAASFLLASVGVLIAHPTWAQSLGVDVWNVPALNQEIRGYADNSREIDEECEVILHRIAVKESIAADLIAHRITLAEATERFTILNESRPDYMLAIRSAHPGKTDQEKMARNVISFAQTQAVPADRPALTQRLEAELQQMLLGSTSP
jgi:hypothetical protein